MDAFLSVQGASAPVKKKSFFSKFTRLNMLRLLAGNGANLLI